MDISNYELAEKIAEAPQTAVYQARDTRNPERLLILKIWKTIGPTEYKQIQFRQKIEHLKVLNDPLVITPVTDRKSKVELAFWRHFGAALWKPERS